VSILIHFNIGIFDNFYRSFFLMKEGNTFFLGNATPTDYAAGRTKGRWAVTVDGVGVGVTGS